MGKPEESKRRMHNSLYRWYIVCSRKASAQWSAKHAWYLWE